MTACSWTRHALVNLIAVAALGSGYVVMACSSRPPGSSDAANGAPSNDPVNDRSRRQHLAEVAEVSGVAKSAFGSDEREKRKLPEIYDPERIPELELTLDDAARATLADPAAVAAKTWVHARFEYGNVTFADVGVRVKGSSTLRLLPGKASLKVKLNKWVKGQKLQGIEELTLNNMVSDPTFLAERVTYHVFRSLGLPAPNANTAHLTINGEDYGIFANVETPDENFLERAFVGTARSLYEVNGGSEWLPGESGDGNFEIDIPAPGAPPGTMPDAELLFQAVAAAKDETLLADLEGRLHTKQWFRHSAAEAVTGHYDGYAYGVWGSHNYFMAGDVGGKFALVPWSTDLSLSNRAGVPDASNPSSTTVLARCKRGSCWDAYKAEVRAVLDVYETLDLVNLARRWHGQIDALVRSDPKREANISYYETETDKLYEFLATRPAVVRAQLGL